MRSIDNITFFVFIGFWPIYLIWEIALLWIRERGISVDLISMQARDRGYQFNTIVVLWFSMPVHFWVNWYRTSTWGTPIPSILFWLFVAGTLTLDIVLWQRGMLYDQLPQWLQNYRFPLTQAILGMVLVYFLFPQKGVLP